MSIQGQIFEQISQDIRDFLGYLTSLWGILAAFSAFFPLFNNLKEVIPSPQTHQKACIALSLLSCIFVVFYRFTSRHQTVYIITPLSALKSFLIGIGISLLYLFSFPQLRNIPIEQIFNGISSRGQIFIAVLYSIGSIIEPFCYILIFGLSTYAFTTLAVIEWQKREAIRRRNNESKK